MPGNQLSVKSRLPSLSGRLKNKSQDADMRTALLVVCFDLYILYSSRYSVGQCIQLYLCLTQQLFPRESV